MTLQPRKLALLRIDDALRDVKLVYWGDTPLDDYIGSEWPPHIDPIHRILGRVFNIASWRTATEFWTDFDPLMRVDLIVADVRFEDTSSPLSFGESTNLLPTGISHFKPFAAIARASGAPIGVGMHTADPSTWEEKTKMKNAVRRLLGKLSAHEIGEIMAILEEAPRFTDLQDNEPALLQKCWNWLDKNTGDDFGEGFLKAMSDFRRRFAKRVTVAPDQWAKLQRWCNEMRDSSETGRLLTDKSDIGFAYYLPDGRQDCISLRSLFADFIMRKWLGGDRSDFNSTRLPKNCFELEPHDKFFELDDDFYPRIGPLVRSCSRTAEAYERAIEFLRYFPYTGASPSYTLTDAADKHSFGSQEQAYAVLFKYVEQQFKVQQAWREAFEIYHWNEDLDQLTDSRDPPTLKDLVTRVSRFLSGEREASVESLQEGLELKTSTVRRCLNILVTTGHVEAAEPNLFRFRSRYADETPPLPLDFDSSNKPSSKLKSLPVDEPLRLPARQFWSFSFGYTSGDYNTFGRVLSEAFGLPGRSAGATFIDDFLAGRAPFLVKLLCRKYAADKLGWLEEQTWPPALR